jgi:ATP-dependent helicase/nuclease subunit B
MIEATMTERDRSFFTDSDDATALDQIAATLLEAYAGDLRRVLVVVPGGRARRALFTGMRACASDRELPLYPPSITTPGALEAALRPTAPVSSATPLAVQCAVAQALEVSAVEGVLAPAFIRATMELSAAQQTWLDVAEQVGEFGGNADRYELLHVVHEDVVQRLDAVGLVDADTARNRALTYDVDQSLDVVLIGVVELSKRAVEALQSVPVRVCILAEPALADGFTALGLIDAAWWAAHPPIVPLENVQLEDKPIDQAEAVVERLSALGESVDPTTTVVVMADETLTDVVERELVAAGSAVHRGQGTAISETEPATLLSALAELLDDGTVASLRAVIAQPSIAAFVHGEEGDALYAIDSWHRHTFSQSIEGDWIGDPEEDGLYRGVAAVRRTLHHVVPRVLQVLSVLRGDSRTLGGWAAPIATVLKTIYSEPYSEDDCDGFRDAALEHIGQALAALQAVPDALQPVGSAAEAIRLLLAFLGGNELRATSMETGRALELIGWLELPFDQAKHVIVVGFNDEAIPGSGGVDPLLPDSLRERLGLATARTRTARDCWVLSRALARRASFTLSYRDSRGEPRLPSRLLLSGQGTELASRVLKLAEQPSTRQHLGGSVTSACVRPLPPPGPQPFDSITVTGFREYLRCPYGFWVRHIVRLNAPDAKGRELDPRDFGNVVHNVAEAYANTRDGNTLSDSDQIFDVLDGLLDDELRRLVGGFPGVAIQLQREILRGRLHAFAVFQSTSVRDGWITTAVEQGLKLPLDIPDDVPVMVRGKVDRIDVHPTLGWRILDLKTSDKGDPPDLTHYAKRAKKWSDLQLPLYRELLSPQLQNKQPGAVTTGYVVLPADNGNAGLQMSKVIQELHTEAIDQAKAIVQAIRAGAFPLGNTPLYSGDDRSLLYRAHSIVDSSEEGE